MASAAFRPDIEGLRAVAVLAVLLDHATGWPGGGFVGVDVFFVISGFLITKLLIAAGVRTGTVDFRGFYANRARRILPAAIVVVLATVVTAYLLWFRARADQTAADALPALLFAANWHFIRVGTDYLSASGPVSPLQHYWSLAVEEQFYLVWPTLLFLVFRLSRACGWSRTALTRLLLLTCAGLTALSFLRCVALTAREPSVAYFDSFSRAWEFGIGAVLAVYVSRRHAFTSRRAASVAFAAGGVAVAVSFFAVGPETAFPGFWAALPVGGTALLLASGNHAYPGAVVIVTNPVMRYIGRISYSLYLWHFPVIIFLTSSFGSSWKVVTSAIAFSFVLADLSYRLVEQPVRRSAWLQGAVRRGSGPRVRRLAVWPVAVAVVVLAAGRVTVAGPEWLGNGALLTQKLHIAPTSSHRVLEPFTSAGQLESAVADAAARRSWPAVVPTLDELSVEDAPPQLSELRGCRNDVKNRTPRVCRAGTAPARRTAVVIGDSVAASWMPAVEGALVPQGWIVRGLAFASCTPAQVDARTRGYDPTFLADCARSRDSMIRWATGFRPSMIILSDDQGTFTRLADGATGEAAVREWQQGMASTLRRLTASGAQVVVLSNPPLGTLLTQCATKLSSPTRCAKSVDDVYERKARAERLAVQSVPGATFVDVRSWFCDPAGQCPPFVDGTVVRIDSTHLTAQFAGRLGLVMRAALSPATL